MGVPALYSHESATLSPIGAVPDPLSGSESLRIKLPLKNRLGRPLVTCHAQSPIDTLTKRLRASNGAGISMYAGQMAVKIADMAS
jgi:hypothetical protein